MCIISTDTVTEEAPDLPRNSQQDNEGLEFDFEARIASREYIAEDADNETSLRPRSMEEYVGQEKIKENLSVFMIAAKQREEPLDHVLLHGPPVWARPRWLR